MPQNESGWFGLPKAADLVFRVPGKSDTGGALPLRGIDFDTPVRFAPKGGAVPGERIVGIRAPEGITIYPIHSPALVAYDDQPELWLDVRWDLDNAPNGALFDPDRGDDAQRARRARRHRHDDRRIRRQYRRHLVLGQRRGFPANCVIDLQVRDIQHLNAILSQLRDKSVVNKVERLSG